MIKIANIIFHVSDVRILFCREDLTYIKFECDDKYFYFYDRNRKIYNKLSSIIMEDTRIEYLTECYDGIGE